MSDQLAYRTRRGRWHRRRDWSWSYCGQLHLSGSHVIAVPTNEANPHERCRTCFPGSPAA